VALLYPWNSVCGRRILFPGREYCEVMQGYVILTLYTTCLHVQISHLLLTLNTTHLVLLHTPQTIVQLMGLKFYIARVCCVLLRRKFVLFDRYFV
jgi:hypothetical protein